MLWDWECTWAPPVRKVLIFRLLAEGCLQYSVTQKYLASRGIALSHKTCPDANPFVCTISAVYYWSTLLFDA